MLTTLTHGTPGLAFIYLLIVAGLLAGRRFSGLTPTLILSLLLLALPVMLGIEILWAIIVAVGGAVFHHLPTAVTDLLGILFLLAAAAVTGAVFARRQINVFHHRGAVLVSGTAPRRRSGDTAPELTLACQPVAAEDETKHFKLIGATGTGKSTAIRELLAGALARGDRAVIADPDGSYLKHFHEPARGDVILNPFDPRAARWDLFAEIRLPHDADQLARSLIPDHEGTDRNWRHYARTFLTAVLRQLHRFGEHDPVKLYYLLALAPADELRDLLEATPAASFLGQDNGKFFESVRSVANVHVAALEHVARQESGAPLSIRTWVREGRGVLFLPYRAAEIAALAQLVSTWMRLAIFETLNGEEEEGDQRLWFIVDELDALGAIDGLKDALARLRKFGGRCVLGLQSIAQARGLYGDAEAQTIVENCGNTLILRCSASERGGTAEFASRLIGQREIIRRHVSHTRATSDRSLIIGHHSRTTSEQHLVEYAVLPSEIEQLPDRAGFLKFASRPAWMMVRFPAYEPPKTAEPSVPV